MAAMLDGLTLSHTASKRLHRPHLPFQLRKLLTFPSTTLRMHISQATSTACQLRQLTVVLGWVKSVRQNDGVTLSPVSGNHRSPSLVKTSADLSPVPDRLNFPSQPAILAHNVP